MSTPWDLWRLPHDVWIGVDTTRDAARMHVAPALEGFYATGFERFEKYTPFGTAAQAAESLAPYVEAGATTLNLTPCGPDRDTEIEMTAEIAQLLDG